MKAFFGKQAVDVQPDDRSLMERILDRLFNKKLIVNCARDPYLHRWYVIRSERFGLFIHKFIRSDEDRALHDHPWSFIVIPIWRGYWEHSQRLCKCFACTEYPDGVPEYYLKSDWYKAAHKGPVQVRRRVLPILGARIRPATYRHRVELLQKRIGFRDMPGFFGGVEPVMEDLPSWSIFIRFKKVRDWGFWLPSGFQHWAAWWREKCE